jgi:hypothetical protein
MFLVNWVSISEIQNNWSYLIISDTDSISLKKVVNSSMDAEKQNQNTVTNPNMVLSSNRTINIQVCLTIKI